MGMDPKQMRVLENGQASEEDLPRDTSREAVRAQEEGRRTMKARRGHSKGDGNFPSSKRGTAVDEQPEDRTAADLPKEADDRSAPKGGTTNGQRDRNPAMEMRDDAKPRRPRAQSGMQRAQRSAAPKRPAKAARPTARRLSAAKRDATKRVVKRNAPKTAKTRGGTTRAKTRGGSTRAQTRGAARSRASRSRR